MVSPLEQFGKREILNCSDPSLLDAAEKNAKGYGGKGVDLAQSFLSAQAELLIRHGCKALNVVSKEDVGIGSKSAGFYDRETNQMTLTADNLGIDMSRTAAHEMTHGLEHRMECGTEERIFSILTTDPETTKKRAQSEVTAIYNAVQFALPVGASKIQEQFRAQVSSGGGAATIVPLEIGAYSNEALFYEINSNGNAKEFIKRYNEIGQEGIKKANRRGKAEAEMVRETAQEIVAMGIYDINTHIIERVQERKGPGDVELAAELQKVNDTVLEAYQRAEKKYKSVFPPKKEQELSPEAAHSLGSESGIPLASSNIGASSSSGEKSTPPGSPTTTIEK